MKKILFIILLVIYIAPATSAKEPTVALRVKIHELPSYVEFAGEQVPVDRPYVREAIDREVLTTTSMHTSTMLMLRAMSRYFPIIEPILAEYGVPNDFRYLAMAESGLNPNAVSHAGAAGLWQFVKSAAKDYNLETGENTDMRFHVEASTHAACQYILAAYERFGSWTLAAASYNVGRTGVARRLDIQGVDNYWDLFLPEETMRYVPRIISLKLISSSPADFDFDLTKKDMFKPYKNYTKVKINSADIDWSKFAAEHGTNYRQLRILNPWIRSYEYKNANQTTYEVLVPNAEFVKKGF